MRVTASGFTSFTLDAAGQRVLVTLGGKLFLFDRASGASKELAIAGPAIDAQLSPDGQRVAFVRNNDLYVFTIATGAEVALTKGGTDDQPYGLAEFIAQEELGRFRGAFWSPDGSQLLYQQTDQTKVERVAVVDVAHPEEEPLRLRYPRPGKANAVVRFGVVAVTGGPTTWIQWDRDAYPYVASVTWAAQAPPVLYVLDRPQRRGLLLAVDPGTGTTRTLLEEHDDKWLDPPWSEPTWTKHGTSFLWMTQRHGLWAVELHEPRKGSVRTLTPKGLDVRSIAAIDDARRAVYVTASEDPTTAELYRVPFDGGAPVLVRKPEGGGLLYASGSSDALVVRELPRRGPAQSLVLQPASGTARVVRSVAERPPSEGGAEIVTVGKHAMRVAIVRPRGFVAGRKAPVIDLAYAGGFNMVLAPEAYYVEHHALADATGAIVVSIDGRGTAHRGREWEHALKDGHGEVAVEDHVAALHDLAAVVPELDLGRVGVTGWSNGGFFSVYALLAHPETFKVAVAGAPVTDWRDYDSACGEKHVGMPDEAPDAYDRQSPLRFLRKPDGTPLRLAAGARPGHLLVVHGTADDNVFFLHSLKLADALTRAGYPFELMPLAGETHLLRDPDLLEAYEARRAEFFRQHL
jgi:dipeptidyl-peptidase-4